MDLRALSIFIEVAELGSFTRAGEKLGYSQPTISFQIKQLEKEMGAQLFDRIGHTVTLTDAAKDYLIAKGYDPIYGARPLKRLIQTEVETLLARWIIAEDPAPDTHITVDYDGTKLTAK